MNIRYPIYEGVYRILTLYRSGRKGPEIPGGSEGGTGAFGTDTGRDGTDYPRKSVHHAIRLRLGV